MSVNPRKRVLIVDDTPHNIQILMETLRDEFTIVAATNGQKALQMAVSDSPPDIILLDVMMPEMDGHEVCRRLKEDIRTKDIPVIFVTALNEERDEARGFSLGAVDYISKPFRPMIAKARVRNHVELKRHRDDLRSLVDEQIKEIADSHIATIFALSKLAESRDDDTGKHLERTQTYCRMLAQNLHDNGEFPDVIDIDYIEMIFRASPLHDIGKVAIPDAILCKPGKLTPEEFDIMKTHTLRGAETLDRVCGRHPRNRFLQMGREIARWHHEKWNGAGYPDGKAADAIPLCARIMAVADVYDALTTERCYKPAFPHEKSRDIIIGDSGTHFDPTVTQAFQRIESDFQRIREELAS